MSDRGSVSAGFGLIEVDAVASIDFEISYGEISHDWFIQPFYLTELMLSFNYRSVSWSSDQRMDLWKRLVRDHYLKQFNEEHGHLEGE